MNKTELWIAFLERYPEFRDEESIVKQRSRGLRALLNQAWDEGHKEGTREAAADTKKNPFGDLFGGFGRK